MDAINDGITSPQHGHGTDLVNNWAGWRRQNTPWAYRHMRGLGALRLTIGAFLVVVGAVLLAHGDARWATLPLLGAVLHFSLGGLDMTAAYSARARS